MASKIDEEFDIHELHYPLLTSAFYGVSLTFMWVVAGKVSSSDLEFWDVVKALTAFFLWLCGYSLHFASAKDAFNLGKHIGGKNVEG